MSDNNATSPVLFITAADRNLSDLNIDGKTKDSDIEGEMAMNTGIKFAIKTHNLFKLNPMAKAMMSQGKSTQQRNL